MTLTELLKLGDKAGIERCTVFRRQDGLCVGDFAAYAYGPSYLRNLQKMEEHVQYLKGLLKIAPALLHLAVVVESAVDETNRFESWGERSYEWSRHRDEIEAALDLVGEEMK